MIYDLMTNAKYFSKGLEPLSKAMAFIKKIDCSVKDGRYEICGDAMYAIVFTYRTKKDKTLPFEAHRKYIDLQCMLKGEERIDVVQGRGFRIKSRYSAGKDALFIYPPKHYFSILLSPGYFTLFYPHDFHRPSQCITAPEEVRKLVIKISTRFLA